MKKTVRLVGLVLAVLLAFCLAPKFPVSADYGDYDSHDIEIINELIRDNNFGFDSWIVWESGISEPPTGWPERVEWNEGTPKKIITIEINGLNSYGSGQVDLSGLKELQGIDIRQTRIGALAVTDLNALQSLTAEHNVQLEVLDVRDNPSLESLKINYSANLKAVDMAGLTGLKTFNCICSYGTPNLKLEALDFSDSGELEVLICSNTRRLSHINLEGLSKLTWLDLYGTLLTSLDVSALADLQILTCMESQLSKLILGKHDKLENLSCQDNNLADLNLRYVSNLKTLDCGSNSDAFVYLDVSHLDNLEVLDCSPGFLKRLDLNKAAPYSSSGVGGVRGCGRNPGHILKGERPCTQEKIGLKQ